MKLLISSDSTEILWDLLGTNRSCTDDWSAAVSLGLALVWRHATLNWRHVKRTDGCALRSMWSYTHHTPSVDDTTSISTFAYWRILLGEVAYEQSRRVYVCWYSVSLCMSSCSWLAQTCIESMASTHFPYDFSCKHGLSHFSAILGPFAWDRVWWKP